jgi:hypothetical protein
MTAPTTKHRPASSSPPSGKQTQARTQRRAYNRRKTRAKARSEALRLKEAAQVEALPVQHPRAADIDVGSRSHWVCVGFTTEANSGLIEEFPAHTAGLKAIAAFLREHQVNTIAMESTGIYWIPLYELLRPKGLKSCSSTPATASNCGDDPRRTAGIANGSTDCIASAYWPRPFGPMRRRARYGPTCGSGPT